MSGPITPGAAWPGEARACRRILLCGSWFRALHICVGRLRYGRACAVPVRACPAGGGRPGAPASPPWGRESGLNQPLSPSLCASRVLPLPRLPLPAGACIVPPRAAPQSMRPREPREPDTAEDAGGQTDHSGQAFQGGLLKDTSFHKPPSFMNSLNPFIFKLLKSFFGRRVRSWLRTNAGGAPNTCKSRG